jgi:hypothetical protein
MENTKVKSLHDQDLSLTICTLSLRETLYYKLIIKQFLLVIY